MTSGRCVRLLVGESCECLADDARSCLEEFVYENVKRWPVDENLVKGITVRIVNFIYLFVQQEEFLLGIDYSGICNNTGLLCELPSNCIRHWCEVPDLC